MWRTTCMLLLSLAVASVSWAQAPAADPGSGKGHPAPPSSDPAATPLEPSAAEPGIDSELWIGDKAPDFELESSLGRSMHLTDLTGHWAVMVFTENRTTLGPFKEIDGELRELGARLYGICKDGAPALKTYAEHERLPFVVLSDLTGQISQTYGMYDVDDDQIQPGIVLLDPKGVVRMALLGQSLHPSEVLQLVRHSVIGA